MSRPRRCGRPVSRILAATSLVAVMIGGGCGRRSAAPEPRPEPGAAADRGPSRPAREKMLSSVLAVLDRLDDFDDAKAAELMFDRVNQWGQSAGGGGEATWQPDPLLDTLPSRLREPADDAHLESMAFTRDGDVVFLRDQRWLADIARVAKGGAVDDLEVAEKLFRWTIRSLAIVGDPPPVPSSVNPGSRWFLPGEILLAGRASSPQRAWIFLELLRHAGLDGVMLATGDRAVGTQRPWVPAVVIDGEAYLFEPTYGMPVPGPGGAGIATVRQAAADPAVLQGLSLPDRPYPLQASDMRGLAVLVAADPWSLARRTQRLDGQVRAAREMRLAVAASRVATAARAAVAAPVAGDDGVASSVAAGLWEFPWETLVRRRADAGTVQAALQRDLAPLDLPMLPTTAGDVRGEAPPPARPLFAARLREFRGEFSGPAGAKAAYMAARPARDALRLAMSGLPPGQAEAVGSLYRQMREDATYWLGVLTLAEGDDATAAEYLGRMTLEAAPDSRWTDAARTNMAQALIGLGRTAEAVAMLRADLSPQRFGSRLLADRLVAEENSTSR